MADVDIPRTWSLSLQEHSGLARDLPLRLWVGGGRSHSVPVSSGWTQRLVSTGAESSAIPISSILQCPSIRPQQDRATVSSAGDVVRQPHPTMSSVVHAAVGFGSRCSLQIVRNGWKLRGSSQKAMRSAN